MTDPSSFSSFSGKGHILSRKCSGRLLGNRVPHLLVPAAYIHGDRSGPDIPSVLLLFLGTHNHV